MHVCLFDGRAVEVKKRHQLWLEAGDGILDERRDINGSGYQSTHLWYTSSCFISIICHCHKKSRLKQLLKQYLEHRDSSYHFFYVFNTAAALEPGWVTVILKSQSAIKLGETKILYVDEEKEFLERVVQEPNLQQKLFSKLACSLDRANPETSSGETQNSGSLGKFESLLEYGFD